MQHADLIRQLALGALPVVFVLGVYSLAARGLRRMEAAGWLTATMQVRLRVLVRWSAGAAATVLVLQALGLINHAWAIITGTAAAVAIGFVAHWSLLSNWASAVLVLMYQRFGIGDEIEVFETLDKPEGMRGHVREINLFYTVLDEVTTEGSPRQLQIPNNLLFQKAVRVRRATKEARRGQ